MTRYLLAIFGRRVLIGYAGVAGLLVMLLAALHFTSQYALQGYVREQLGRLPWDLSLYQMEEADRFPELRAQYQGLPEATRVEEVGLLRMLVVPPLAMEVDGEPVFLPWLMVVAATDPRLLPPELQHGAWGADRWAGGADLALIGPQEDIRAYLARITEGSLVRVSVALEEHVHPSEIDPHDDALATIFSARVNRVSHVDRQDLIKWFVREVGGVSFVPAAGVVVAVPTEAFAPTAREFQRVFRELEHDEGLVPHVVSPNYVPEVVHLIGLRQEAIVSPWDLEASLERLRPLGSAVYGAGRTLTPFVALGSDLLVLLDKMNAMARLVGLATLLISIPLLWVGWMLAVNIGQLILLNERRLVGLARLRGIPIASLQRTLVLALVLGGLGGGLGGLGLGVALPWLGYQMAGGAAPPADFLARELGVSLPLVLAGVALAILAGRRVTQYVQRLTPREAVARIVAVEQQSLAQPFRWTHGLALFLGSYKLAVWLWGWSLGRWIGTAGGPRELSDALAWGESILNFVAVPLLLFSLIGLGEAHVGSLQRGLRFVVAPIVAARLRWFVASHMALRSHRLASLLLMAALVLSVSLAAQVSADSFSGRAARGAQANLGADLSFIYSAGDLAGGELAVDAVSRGGEVLAPRIDELRASLSRQSGVTHVEPLVEFSVPGFYVPGQSGLPLYLLTDPDRYLQSVYFEEALGLTRPFSAMVADLSAGDVIASQGLFRVRRVALGSEVVIGAAADGSPVRLPVTDAADFLPGIPGRVPHQREGYVGTEIDYLNHLSRTQAYLVADGHNRALQSLQALPSRVAFLVRTEPDANDTALAQTLTGTLPFRPTEVRTQTSERAAVGKDMFVSLALENMKAYVVGGIVAAIVGVLAVALVNFFEDRRTFALLRIRGVSQALLLRIALALFFGPVGMGVVAGIALGIVSGYGFAEAIWDLPRVRGIETIGNRLVLTPTAAAIGLLLSLVFAGMALLFGLGLFRRSAREGMREA